MTVGAATAGAAGTARQQILSLELVRLVTAVRGGLLYWILSVYCGRQWCRVQTLSYL